MLGQEVSRQDGQGCGLGLLRRQRPALRPLQVVVQPTPLSSRRPPLGFGYAVLLRSLACWLVRTCAEINLGELFGNFDGFAPWCLGVCAGRMWGSAPST